VAARLLERKSVVFKEYTLLISEPGQSAESAATPQVISDASHHYMHTVKVTNVEITKDMLKLYFENAKRSHGGEVKHLNLITEKKKAFVTFKDPSGTFVK